MRFSFVNIKTTENPFVVDLFEHTLNQHNIIYLPIYFITYLIVGCFFFPLFLYPVFLSFAVC
jgi:hypothetical protein